MFSDFIAQQDSLRKLLPSFDTLNHEWCLGLIKHLNATEEEEPKTAIFISIIKNFNSMLQADPSLLKQLQFPCNNNEWDLLENIYQGNGWGATDGATYEFLKLCGYHNKIVYLRSKMLKFGKALTS